jgi:hypothetical protein
MNANEREYKNAAGILINLESRRTEKSNHQGTKTPRGVAVLVPWCLDGLNLITPSVLRIFGLKILPPLRGKIFAFIRVHSRFLDSRSAA